MIKNISIKSKLLIYNFLIYLSLLSIFSFSLYKALELSSLDKIESSLKVILLDIVDDIKEHKDKIKERTFDEEKEYKFEPLYIRLIKYNDSKVINTTYFPKEIKEINFNSKIYQLNKIYFENKNNYIIARIKINVEKVLYIVDVGTNHKLINDTLLNLLYILAFIIPIILLLSIIAGYFIIQKSFSPVENILLKLEDININNLSFQRLDTKENVKDEIDLLTKKINDLLNRIESSYQRVSQFSADASHELKTPLTVILGETEHALQKIREPKEYEKVLEKVYKEAIQIQNMINDLLFLSKVEKIDTFINEDVYLDEVSIETCEELNDFASLKNVNLNISIEEPMTIKGNKKLLKIALSNIIKNAIIYSNKNSTVFIKNLKQNKKNIILVEDSGVGITEKEQKKVFESFYRSDKSRNKKSGGTGLGLSICKKIIDMHSGEIIIKSERKVGTIISIVLF